MSRNLPGLASPALTRRRTWFGCCAAPLAGSIDLGSWLPCSPSTHSARCWVPTHRTSTGVHRIESRESPIKHARSDIASLPMPFVGDQPFWAERPRHLGTATPPLSPPTAISTVVRETAQHAGNEDLQTEGARSGRSARSRTSRCVRRDPPDRAGYGNKAAWPKPSPRQLNGAHLERSFIRPARRRGFRRRRRTCDHLRRRCSRRSLRAPAAALRLGATEGHIESDR